MIEHIYDAPYIDVTNNRAGILINHKSLGLIALCFDPAISATSVEQAITCNEFENAQYMILVDPMTNKIIAHPLMLEELAKDFFYRLKIEWPGIGNPFI